MKGPPKPGLAGAVHKAAAPHKVAKQLGSGRRSRQKRTVGTWLAQAGCWRGAQLTSGSS